MLQYLIVLSNLSPLLLDLSTELLHLLSSLLALVILLIQYGLVAPDAVFDLDHLHLLLADALLQVK